MQNTCKSKDRLISWDEVKQHASSKDNWIVVEDLVYDVSSWGRKHPGGQRILTIHAGEDATETFRAFHPDLKLAQKYMKVLQIGRLEKKGTNDLSKEEQRQEEMKKDFEELRQTAVKMGLFKASKVFFGLHLSQVILCEILAYLVMHIFGTGWTPFLCSIVFQTIAYGQASWTQHDYGHRAAFPTLKINRSFHRLVVGNVLGTSGDGWNYGHNQHHAKTNIQDIDPDTNLEPLLVLGEVTAKRVAGGASKVPHNLQHIYFIFAVPPLLAPVYLQYLYTRYQMFKKNPEDFLWTLTHYIKSAVLYIPLLGFKWALIHYVINRLLGSMWLGWCFYASHLPMPMTEASVEHSWLNLHLVGTCNTEGSFFNDWFTGGLNYQIEHHLFPTMPRHNYPKIQPLVKSLCKKHDLPYIVKTLGQSFVDIIRALKTYGEAWQAGREAKRG